MISQLFITLVEWAGLKGADDLAQKPGLWLGELGEWRVAINAHREEQKTPDGLTVAPFNIALTQPRYLGAVMLLGAHGGIGASGLEDEALADFIADAERLKAEA